MQPFSHDMVRHIQEDKLRRSLSNYRAPGRYQDCISANPVDSAAVVIDLDLTDPEEATRLIGA